MSVQPEPTRGLLPESSNSPQPSAGRVQSLTELQAITAPTGIEIKNAVDR